jgi:uncharacterized protein YjbJ (UPF0337 family)
MNWDIIEGKWKQATGAVKTKWGKLTDDDLKAIGGKRDQLVGKLQERYGLAKDQAEKQLADFEHDFRDPQTSDKQPAPSRR